MAPWTFNAVSLMVPVAGIVSARVFRSPELPPRARAALPAAAAAMATAAAAMGRFDPQTSPVAPLRSDQGNVV
jgi:hypothetical protein